MFNAIMDPLYEAFGNLLGYIYYNLTPEHNKYGIAIIIFTLIIKIILLPFAIKQQKAMMGMQKIQPHIEEIKAKYKNDMNKMNEETMKLYAEHKVNPFGSCLPALLQFPIFIALYATITQPLKYVLKFTENQLYGINHTLNFIYPADQIKSQIQMIDKSKEIIFSASGNNIINYVTTKIQEVNNFPNLLEILNKYGYTQNNLSEISNLFEKVSNLSLDFLGLNLAQTPSISSINPIIIIPILAAVTTYLSSKLMSGMTPQAGDNTTQNTMMIMMPVMTLFFTFSMPAGLGLYWIVSNVIQIIQQFFLNKYIPKEVIIKK